MKYITAVLIASAIVGLPFAILAPGTADKRKKAAFYGRNIAHRGLYKADQSVPENSLKAFELAVGAGYGIELDVQLSKDGRVVVFHDDTLLRVCGVDRRVDELTFEELSSLRLFDTDQTVPLFSDVLALVAGKTPLVVELKTGRHNKQLCEKTLAHLRQYGGEYCIESFDPTIVAWFARRARDVMRGQLTQHPSDFKGTGVSAATGLVLGNLLLNVIARPHFVAHRVGKKTPAVKLCERMGAMRFAWTCKDPSYEGKCDAAIFEHYLPGVKFK